jgi:hypothetical protein
MRLCLITPTKGLTKYATQSSDIHLCLVQEILKDKEYAAFYRTMSDLGQYIIMDNGTFEQGHPCETDEILKAMEIVKARCVVTPDFPNEPWEITREACHAFAEKIPAQYELMVVPQTRVGCVEEYFSALWEMLMESATLRSLPQVKYVAVSILSAPNAVRHIVGSDEPEICRNFVMMELQKWLKTHDVFSRRIHCLGLGSRIDLIQYYWSAYSLDTSSPVWHGWNGIGYTSGLLLQGKIKKSVDFQAELPNELFGGLIQQNIDVLQNYAAQADARRE